MGPLLRTSIWALFLTLPGCAVERHDEDRVSVLASGFPSRIQRISAVSQRLLTPLALTRPARVLLLDSQKVNAYSWPDGRIYVTRGLVDLLTDEELTAALCHELGHLLQDGHVTVAALQGFSAYGDCEAKADAWGCQLLEARGCSPSAMITMLEKVRGNLDADPARQQAVSVRISLLRSSAHKKGGVDLSDSTPPGKEAR